MNRGRQRIEELLSLVDKVRKRDREVRTHFHNAFYGKKHLDITRIIISLRYLFGRLEELYDAAAVTKEYVTSERIMEQVRKNKKIKVKGLPHRQYIKAQAVEEIVNRLCEDSIDGNINTDDILTKTENIGINQEETYKLLEWMKRFDMVDKVEKDKIRSTEGMIPLQPDIVKLMREELGLKDEI
jgi:hypothetical protein